MNNLHVHRWSLQTQVHIYDESEDDGGYVGPLLVRQILSLPDEGSPGSWNDARAFLFCKDCDLQGIFKVDDDDKFTLVTILTPEQADSLWELVAEFGYEGGHSVFSDEESWLNGNELVK